MQHPELPLLLQILRRRPRGRNTIRNDVRFGSEADIETQIGDVRLTPASGHYVAAATTSSNQPETASNISDLISASLRPVRAGT
jgi:hypothetical protein